MILMLNHVLGKLNSTFQCKLDIIQSCHNTIQLDTVNLTHNLCSSLVTQGRRASIWGCIHTIGGGGGGGVGLKIEKFSLVICIFFN